MLRATGKKLLLLFLLVLTPANSHAQEWIRAKANLGNPIRLATPDFKAVTTDPPTIPLSTVFNQTLWNDLDNSGILELVAKSLYPLRGPGSPGEIKLDAWNNPPLSASMVAFGNLGVSGGELQVQGWLFDAKNTVAPQVLGKQYREAATADNARLIAHRFADEIVFRLGEEFLALPKAAFFLSAPAAATMKCGRWTTMAGARSSLPA